LEKQAFDHLIGFSEDDVEGTVKDDESHVSPSEKMNPRWALWESGFVSYSDWNASLTENAKALQVPCQLKREALESSVSLYPVACSLPDPNVA